MVKKINVFSRDDFTAALGEFLGTAYFLFMGNLKALLFCSERFNNSAVLKIYVKKKNKLLDV